MKIYIIPAWYPKNESDVTANFFRDQAHALADRGHDVTVIHIEPVSVTQIGRQPAHAIREWQDGNVRTVFHKVIIPVPAKFTSLQDKVISKVFYGIIKNQIKSDLASGSGIPDLIHAHVSHSCAYYCLYGAKKLDIPLVVTEHYSGLLLKTATDREYERVRQTIEEADAFIFVGSNFQKTLCEDLKTKKSTFVVPNMISLDEFEIKNKKNDKFRFLSAGNLKANKSFNLVIKAFHQEFGDSEPVELVIAGDGDQRDNLAALIKELKEENRVSMFGKYIKEQSKTLFSDADAFILTSKVETFGIVYIEALSSGIPCIGTKGQGADDIISDKNGFLVEYGNVDELAARMRDLYSNISKYNPQALRRDCTERFSRESVCQKIESVYDNVLKGNTK